MGLTPAEWTTVALTSALVLFSGMQAVVLVWQSRIAGGLADIERERRKEEGALVEWARLRDDDTVGENVMTHGRIFQAAVWNQGTRTQIVWDAEFKVIGSSKDGQYEVSFAEHGGTKFYDRHWSIPGKSASRVQILVDASVIDAADIEEGWIFLRYRTPEGPEYTILNSPGGKEPSSDEVLKGWVVTGTGPSGRRAPSHFEA